MLMKTYLKRAHLKGFRTIKDLSVEFNPGLNIIIGKNGTGKTNFLTFLDKMIRNEYLPFTFLFSDLAYSGGKEFRIISNQTAPSDNEEDSLKYLFTGKRDFAVSLDQEEYTFSGYDDFEGFLNEKRLQPQVLFIPHGTRTGTRNGIIDAPFSFSYSREKMGINNLFQIFRDKENSWFLRSFALSVFIDLYKMKISGVLTNEIYKNKVLVHLDDFCDRINGSIGNYLPISAIRLSSAFKVYVDSSDDSARFEHLSFEYQIDHNWLPFSSLSDGTKRLFCMYADLLAVNDFHEDGFTGYYSKYPIILLEEPELGIHPHQFHLIMTLLKELSKESQIIITTHAPQALNIFNQDELDSIYLCTHDAEKGTQISRMTEEQQEKAKFYMEDLYLSDYWLTSNFDL